MFLLNQIMNEQNISVYNLSKITQIPYSTLNDLYNCKTSLSKCSAYTVYKISNALQISMEELIKDSLQPRINFNLFRSNVCHELKILGDIDFIIKTLEEDKITKYYNLKWYPESLYILAMLDYVSRINDVSLCNKYNEVRKMKLEKTVFPSSVIALFNVLSDEKLKLRILNESIPEFIRFNIVESEVRNVV